MIFFSLIETLNKLLGLIIIALLSRILGIENFVFYSSIMVVFSYFFELSNFSFQNKNLVDAASSKDFIYSEIYIHRLFSIFFISMFSFIAFYFLWEFDSHLKLLPLALILLLPFLNFDFYLFATDKGKYVVISRFISQIIVIIMLYLFYFFEIDDKNIFWVNFFQSYLLSFLLILFALASSGLNLKQLLRTLFIPKFIDIINQLRKQLSIFLSKISMLIVSSVEIVFSLFYKNPIFDNLVLGNRIVIIIIPFIQFYINSNIKKINNDNYINYILFNSVIVSLIILVSPTIITILFGKEMLNQSFNINFFIPLVIFQAFINYVYITNIKYNLSSKFFYGLLFLVITSIIMLMFFARLDYLNIQNLIYIIYFKCILSFFLAPEIPLKNRLFTFFAFILPVFLNIICFKYTYFENYEFYQNKIGFILKNLINES
tara:strand:- start:1369 stop:2661 length:1293 start_codon:yes stop_codon:yes gene_type:complete